MEFDLSSILNYLAFINGLPKRLGYTKISNELRKYAVEYGITFEEDELLNDWTGHTDNEAAYFVHMFGESFKAHELYFILKDMLKKNGLIDVLEEMIVQNAEEYETESIESLPNLKQQLVDTKKVLAGKYSKVDEYLTRAFTKLISGTEIRNALDDLRFALEQLLQVIYSNGKTLENNIDQLRKDIKARDVEPHVASMIGQLLTLYPDYQNNHVKHHDSFNPSSADFIFDITTTIIKLIVKIF